MKTYLSYWKVFYEINVLKLSVMSAGKKTTASGTTWEEDCELRRMDVKRGTPVCLLMRLHLWGLQDVTILERFLW